MSGGGASEQILVLADDSPSARAAVRVAAEIARALASPLAILGVTGPGGRDPAIASALSEAQAFARTRVSGIETLEASGDLVEVARRRVASTPTSLVAMGAKFRAGDPGQAVASRIWSIVKALSPPVLAITARTEEIRRSLFCTGGERFIEEGAAFAARLLAAVGAEVAVFHVAPHAPAMYGGRVEREELSAEEFLQSNSRVARNVRRQIDIFRAAGVSTSFRMAAGDVVDCVLSEIRRGDPDLVVVGSVPRRGAIQSYMLGDVTRQILARARKPFLVLRSKAPGFWAEVFKAFTEGAAGRPSKPPGDSSS